MKTTYSNINSFFKQKENKIKKLKRPPLINFWISLPTMEDSLNTIDKKIDYLLKNSHLGGEGKLKQWLLTDDIGFCTLSAERYIIDYLRSKNHNITDNLGREGIDSYIDVDGNKIGIEITTLNGLIENWIFQERLFQYISSKNLLMDKTIRIQYYISRIIEEKQKLYEYIECVGDSIEHNDIEQLKNAEIEIEIEKRWTGAISWNAVGEDESKWLSRLTTGLYNTILQSKTKQLSEYGKNLIFIGVNHMDYSNWAIPSIFDAIGNGGNNYSNQIDFIRSFWKDSLKQHKNISGICFFCYSLNNEDPFYPLKIFWRDDNDKIDIKLI